jgi:hypothetical protein
MTMAFKGTLKEFKVPDILQLFSLQRKTGILTFTSASGFITLIFDKGSIAGVDSFPKKLGMRVGNVLVKQDLISDEMLNRALSIQKRTNQKIGEILLSMGLIDQDKINEALEIQAVEIILSLFKWKKGEYNFKVLDRLDPAMITVEPIATENIVMEGVQMLDEWPLIKQQIPEGSIVFEPIPIGQAKIQIIDDFEDDVKSDDEVIYLTETEANLLKYVNGKNSVTDLVELGVVTEYKVYKYLFNLIRKSIIKSKEVTRSEEIAEEMRLHELKLGTKSKINRIFYGLLIFLIFIFFLSFFKPLKPFNRDNIIFKDELYKKVIVNEHDAEK